MRTAGRSIKADVSGRYSVIPSVGISVLQELCVVLAPDLFSQERVEQGWLFALNRSDPCVDILAWPIMRGLSS